MANVTEHDSELEGKCHRVEQAGVHLSLARHPLGVGHGLRSPHEFVGFEERGRVGLQFDVLGQSVGNVVELAAYEGVADVVGHVVELDQTLGIIHLLLGDPAVGLEGRPQRLEEVHGGVHALFAQNVGDVQCQLVAVVALDPGAVLELTNDVQPGLVLQLEFVLDFAV